MKLLCPHCGVKGSAEDSYSGRTVKCPKCQGVFEVKPDMAFEQPEDATLLSATSSTITESPTSLDDVEAPITVDEDFGETGADGVSPVDEAVESVEVDEALTESEPVPTPAIEQEERLDWEDVASEIDLQLAEGEIGEEDEETAEDSPADLNSFHDQFEKSTGDIGLTVEEDSEAEDESGEDIWAVVEEETEEIEETDLTEESSLLAAVDSEGPEQELEDELAETVEIDENHEEGILEGDSDQSIQEGDDVELEPYGIDKEECWQCGKKESLGEPFIAKDGRLYCIACTPIEGSENITDTSQDQGVEDTAYVQAQNADDTGLTDGTTEVSDNKFSIREVIRKSWVKTKGAKGVIWAGSAIMYLVILVIVAGGAFLLPSLSDLTNVTGLVSNILFQSITNIFSVLFTAGLLFMGIRKVAGDKISWKMIFKGFSYAGKIIIATILQSLLVTIGFLLLILPGIYLVVGYAMTLPLIVDKGLSPWQAMEVSRKAIHKIWWRVAGMFVVVGLIFVVSLIPLGLGLIWTWPMFIILAGVVYQHLFVDEGSID